MADARIGGAMRVAVLGGFAVAVGCAALLMVGRGDGAGAQPPGDCGRLCAAGAGAAPTVVAGQTAGGTAPPAVPGHQGRSVPEGSATPPAGSGTIGGGPGSGPGLTGADPGGPDSTGRSSSGRLGAAAQPAGDGRAVLFTVTSAWATGYQVNVEIDNNTATADANWQLMIRLGGPPALHPPVSNGNATLTGDWLTITPADWNRVIAAGGHVVVNLGFDGQYVPPPNPGDCLLDGAPCVAQITVQHN